ncbi:hypothetical protein ACJX0J_029040, partial [Zea mays]
KGKIFLLRERATTSLTTAILYKNCMANLNGYLHPFRVYIFADFVEYNWH